MVTVSDKVLRVLEPWSESPGYEPMMLGSFYTKVNMLDLNPDLKWYFEKNVQDYL